MKPQTLGILWSQTLSENQKNIIAMVSVFSHLAHGEESISEEKSSRSLRHISKHPNLSPSCSEQFIKTHFENPAPFMSACESLKGMSLTEKLKLIEHALPLAVEDDLFDEIDMPFLERVVNGLFDGNQRDLILRHIQLSFELEQVKELLGVSQFFDD